MTRAEREEIRDQIDTVRGEIEEIDADWTGLYEELRDVRERIAAAKVAKATAKARLAELRAILRPPVTNPVTEEKSACA